jgi:hypothetical protein
MKQVINYSMKAETIDAITISIGRIGIHRAQ